jgi:hypothetical protein
MTEGLLVAIAAGLAAWAIGTWGGVTLLRLVLPDVTWAAPTLDYRTLVGTIMLASAPDSLRRVGNAGTLPAMPWVCEPFYAPLVVAKREGWE